MLRSHPSRRRGVLGLAAVALSFGLAACADESHHDGDSNPSDTRTASNGDVFNEADVEFATNMIPHHAQAVRMVTLTDGRTLDPAVEQLANEIRDAQVPEIETMSDWLTAWDEEVPETSLDHEPTPAMIQARCPAWTARTMTCPE